MRTTPLAAGPTAPIPRGRHPSVDYDRRSNVVMSTRQNYVAAGSSRPAPRTFRRPSAYDSLSELSRDLSRLPRWPLPATRPAPLIPAAWHYVYDAMGHVTNQTPPSAQPGRQRLSPARGFDRFRSFGRLGPPAQHLLLSDRRLLRQCAPRHTDASYDTSAGGPVTRTVCQVPGTELGVQDDLDLGLRRGRGQQLSTAFDGFGRRARAAAPSLRIRPARRTGPTCRAPPPGPRATYNPDGTVSTRTDASGASVFELQQARPAPDRHKRRVQRHADILAGGSTGLMDHARLAQRAHRCVQL